MKAIPFDFSCLNHGAPAGMTIKQANSAGLVLERRRDYSVELFGVIKSGENEFSLMRVNQLISPGAVLFSEESVILASPELAVVLRALGYRC